MRILLMTHLFAPSIGGIETMSLLLARAFTAAGNEVRIVTATPSEAATHDHGFSVLRRPDPPALLRACRWADVCFHNNISLAFAWPALLLGKPWVVTTQTWIARADGSLGWRERLKRVLLHRAHSFAISRAVGRSLPVPSVVIPNCYDPDTFRPALDQTGHPANDLIFVGRLVSDKGVDLAIAALDRLRERGLQPNLTIVGDGPERQRLEMQVASHGLGAQVTFSNALQGAALARALQGHPIQLVPSRWAEPFGIVALEGAACGCIVLGSRDGGLAEAIGPCGATFPNGDTDALASLIEATLGGRISICEESRRTHLLNHTPAVVAGGYLSAFEALLV
jgi:glycosyltransferase involved in cell wall biosynthesis